MSIDTATVIARLVREHGGRALVVGGWVRDRLLGQPGKDVDVEVYGLPAPRLKTLLATLAPVNTVGESFTVYKVLDVDVSLPRRESKIGRGHRAFEVSGDPDMAPDEAARRRDFTVNAIAWDPLTGAYLDPFDGRRDLLERRVLRAVDPRTFGDDSLRVLRGLQFAARFALEMDAGTREICRRIPLDDLPAERIWGEFEKLLLQAERPAIGFALARELGVIHQLLPEMARVALQRAARGLMTLDVTIGDHPPIRAMLDLGAPIALRAHRRYSAWRARPAPHAWETGRTQSG
jgi:tRNA nucleotidyltransferase (CCA-adding enzyme)